MDAPQQTDQQKEIQSERLPFDAEFMKRSEEFCNAIMAAVPELHGLALVPLWNSQPENAPPGVLSLRSKEPPFTASLLMLIRRLSLFSVDVHKDLVGQIRLLDQYAAHVAEQVRQQKEELAKIATNESNNDQQG
jgi:hypothetical protein